MAGKSDIHLIKEPIVSRIADAEISAVTVFGVTADDY